MSWSWKLNLDPSRAQLGLCSFEALAAGPKGEVPHRQRLAPGLGTGRVGTYGKERHARLADTDHGRVIPPFRVAALHAEHLPIPISRAD